MRNRWNCSLTVLGVVGLCLLLPLMSGCEDDDGFAPPSDVAGVWRVSGPGWQLDILLEQEGHKLWGVVDYQGAWWEFDGQIRGVALTGRVYSSRPEPSVEVNAQLGGEQFRGFWRQGIVGSEFTAVLIRRTVPPELERRAMGAQ